MVIDIDRDTNGNLLILAIKYLETAMNLVVIYGLNEDSDFYSSLLEKLKIRREQGPLIICGDWNLVLNHERDTFGYVRENNVKAQEIFLFWQ